MEVGWRSIAIKGSGPYGIFMNVCCITDAMAMLLRDAGPCVFYLFNWL